MKTVNNKTNQKYYKNTKKTKKSSFFIYYIKYNGDIMSKENFKKFAKKHKQLSNLVETKQTTWQDLYELYDIYGEDDKIWNKYLYKNEINIKELINKLKNIELTEIQTHIESIQKTLSFFLELLNKEDKEYKPNNLYKTE